MVAGTGGGAGRAVGQVAKAFSSFATISAREKEPETAAIMWAGWYHWR